MKYRVTVDTGDRKLTREFKTRTQANRWLMDLTRIRESMVNKGETPKAWTFTTEAVK